MGGRIRGKKAQAGQEILLQYGWIGAVLGLILVAVNVVGLPESNMFLPESCVGTGGFSCEETRVTTSTVQLVLSSTNPQTVTISAMTLPQCSGSASGTLEYGEMKTFTIDGCTLEEGDKLTEDFSITYNKGNGGLDRTKKGRLIAKVT